MKTYGHLLPFQLNSLCVVEFCDVTSSRVTHVEDEKVWHIDHDGYAYCHNNDAASHLSATKSRSTVVPFKAGQIDESIQAQTR